MDLSTRKKKDSSSILNNIDMPTYPQKQFGSDPEVLEQEYGMNEGQISQNLIGNTLFISNSDLINPTLSTYFGCTIPSSGTSLPINQPVIFPGRNQISLDKNPLPDIPVRPEESMNYASNQNHYGQPTPKPSDVSQEYLQANPNMGQTSSQNETSLGTRPVVYMNQISDQILKEIRSFTNVDPLFNSKNQGSIGEFLVNVLREYLSQIPLDDFYNSLYTPQGEVTRSPMDGIKLHRAILTESGIEGIELCKRIIENLFSAKSDGSSEPHSGDQLQSSLLNKHEILRVFLAIKVIFDAVQVVENPSRSDGFLLRASIYNSYYIICQKLSQKYRTSSNSIDLQYDIILSQSRFGKVFRMNFPNLNANRLGRRGNSKFSYRGITWNNLLIDEDIKTLSEGHLSDIKYHFKPKLQRNPKEPYFNDPEPVFLDDMENNGLKLTPEVQLIKSVTRKPLYSFVDLSDKFPGSYCSLRIWEITPGKLPQQSQWSTGTMEKSLEALERYGVNIAASIIHVQSDGFSPESVSWFLENALQKIRILMGSFACEEIHLHLYLVVTLLISPLVFASNHELTANFKPKLSACLSNFVERLEGDFLGMPLHQKNIMGFAKIIRKMISCIKALLSCLPTSLAKRTLKTLGYDENFSKDPHMVKVMEKISIEIIQRGVVTACNALDWEFAEEHLRENLHYRSDFIQNMTALYLNFSNKILPCSELSESAIDSFGHSTYELPLQIFSDLSRLFHEVLMEDPFVLQLPIKLIELMVNSVINEFQTAAFHNFRDLDPEISKEIFKSWWIHSIAVQGHMSIFCEAVALSMRIQ